MNKKAIYPIIALVLTAGIFFGFFIRVKAQKIEEVLPYLDERFKQENIPVAEINIVKYSPLHLSASVQGAGEWGDSENSALWKSIQRVVFLDAREAGYHVESLTGILQNRQGEQLDYTEQDAGQVQFDRPVTPRAPSGQLTDEETEALLLKKIDPLLDEYHLGGIPITVDIFSEARKQKVIVEIQVDSQEVAENAVFFAWTLPTLSLFAEANAEGANIFWYQPRVIDENGTNLTEMISWEFPHLSDDGETDLNP